MLIIIPRFAVTLQSSCSLSDNKYSGYIIESHYFNGIPFFPNPGHLIRHSFLTYPTLMDGSHRDILVCRTQMRLICAYSFNTSMLILIRRNSRFTGNYFCVLKKRSCLSEEKQSSKPERFHCFVCFDFCHSVSIWCSLCIWSSPAVFSLSAFLPPLHKIRILPKEYPEYHMPVQN